MKRSIILRVLLASCSLAMRSVAADSAASVISELHQLTVDPAQTYHVLDLQLSRGDIRIYLTAGTLAFAKSIAGKVVAAVFTAANTEAGDAEVLVLPPTRSERASLAQFTKSPNLATGKEFAPVVAAPVMMTAP